MCLLGDQSSNAESDAVAELQCIDVGAIALAEPRLGIANQRVEQHVSIIATVHDMIPKLPCIFLKVEHASSHFCSLS